MSLVAAPPASAPAPAVADAIAGDGWLPNLSIAAFRAAQRIGTPVADLRVREALIGGVFSVAAEIRAWRAAQVAAGWASLATVPLGEIAGEPVAVLLWRRAVYAYAAADLAETHNDITATEPARLRNEERAAGAPDLLRTATLAVRDLLGRTRSRVRLL